MQVAIDVSSQSENDATMKDEAGVSRFGGREQSWASDDTRAGLHYALFLGVYSVYGYQVCPFLEQLSWFGLLAPVAGMLAIQLLLRRPMRAMAAKKDMAGQVRTLFWSDLLSFVAGGVILAFFNLFVFGFPLDSGGKVLFAFSAIGFYISLDLALERDHRLAKVLSRSGKAFPIKAQFMPYKQKFLLFSVLNIGILAGVCVLLFYKDLHWISETRPDPAYALYVIMAEVIFVISVLFAYNLRVISQYSRNMNASLMAENNGLRAVQDGALDVVVPITSNDEFGHMASLTNQMVSRLRLSRDQLEQTQDVTMMSLISLAAKRDNETGLHLRRTQTYVAMLAEALRKKPVFGDRINDDMIALLFKSAPLHDIGKVGIPDAILKKPGKLTDEEFVIMKTHAQIGADALKEAEEALGGCSFLSMAREIAQTHHEKWDGSGYPNQLVGDDIPLSGRLMALADVYDALRSPRVYKPGFSHEKAKSIIVEGRGRHFDPDIVDAFLSIEGQIETLSHQMADKTSEPDENAKTNKESQAA